MATKASPRAELAALRALTHKDKRVSGTLLSLIDESYFNYTESQEVYSAVLRHMRETGTTPAYRLLIEDPAISE
ncbi:hypothetical protein, partial [Enterococcus faecalis]